MMEKIKVNRNYFHRDVEPQEFLGIIPRAVENLFDYKDVKFTVSYMELYNDKLRDLLLPPPPPQAGVQQLPQDLVR